LAREDASPFILVYKISGDLKHVKPKEKSGKEDRFAFVLPVRRCAGGALRSRWRILRDDG
jgi:hypothetical protein